MIPFRDNIPSRTFPIVTILLILANVAAFLYELSLGDTIETFIGQYGLIPAYAASHLVIVPFFTSIFLHGGWLHLIGNMWYLWIFGDNVEDRLGHSRYFLFYILCGLGAGLTHAMLNSGSTVPSIGASGAIAGVLGAYLVSYPFAKVQTIFPIFIFIQIIEIPALVVLGLWFVMQFFSGAAAITSSAGENSGGVAWWAHVGGFLFGIVLLAVFKKQERVVQRLA